MNKEYIHMKIILPVIFFVAVIAACEKEPVNEIPVFKSDTLCMCNSTFNINTVSNTYTKGNGNIITKHIDVSQFSKIELKKIGNVEISEGNNYDVEISDYENLIDFAIITVFDEKLVINFKDTCIKDSKLKVKVNLPEPLYSVVVSGSGCIDILSSFNDLRELSLTGGGNITAHSGLNTDDIYINLEGAGTIFATGKTTNLTANLSGVGNIDIAGITCKYADCLLSGNGNINISVSSSLIASLSGTGNIIYFGDPLLEKNITGTGYISKGN